MATDIARDLDSQLLEAKAALHDQAEAMLDFLLRFESQLQARLEAAEAKIAALRDIESIEDCEPTRVGCETAVTADKR